MTDRQTDRWIDILAHNPKESALIKKMTPCLGHVTVLMSSARGTCAHSDQEDSASPETPQPCLILVD